MSPVTVLARPNAKAKARRWLSNLLERWARALKPTRPAVYVTRVDAKTGETLAVICAVNWDGQEYQLTPFASMFNGNPYEMVIPPNPKGGF